MADSQMFTQAKWKQRNPRGLAWEFNPLVDHVAVRKHRLALRKPEKKLQHATKLHKQSENRGYGDVDGAVKIGARYKKSRISRRQSAWWISASLKLPTLC